MIRPFRFGVVAPVLTDLPAWRDRVRRIADSGYSTLLMPDVPLWQPAPGPTLALAAALTDLRVGTWVYASPLRPAWSTAWEAHSLSVLTEGRFEMGIGTGRPGIEDELRERGIPVVPPGQRLAGVRETVTALRELDGPDLHTPVVMAVRGPKAQALAAEVADTVTFAVMPTDTRADVARMALDFRAVRDVELAAPRPRHRRPRGGVHGLPTGHRSGCTACGGLAGRPPGRPSSGRRGDPATARGDRVLLLRRRRRRRRGLGTGGSQAGRPVARTRQLVRLRRRMAAARTGSRSRPRRPPDRRSRRS